MTKVREEIRALLRLSPLVLAAVLAVAMLWQADSAAISGFLQSSPISPVETPTTIPATPTFELPPTLTPTEAVTATVWPTVPSFPVTPTLTLPTEMVTPTATITATVLPPTTAPAAPATSEPSVEPTGSQAERYPEEDTGLKFEWGMLFDSTALFLSRVWLCCGVLVFLAIPVAFVVLWVASKRRQQRGG